MKDILSPSRLLPATIVMTTAVLGIKAFALATAVPSVSDWRVGTHQVLELASAARMIGQAYAATGQAAESPPSLPRVISAASGVQAVPPAPMQQAAPAPGGETQQAETEPAGMPPSGTQPPAMPSSGIQPSGTQQAGAAAPEPVSSAPPQAAPPQAAPPQAAPPQAASPQAAPPQAPVSQAAAPQVAPSPVRGAVDADIGLSGKLSRGQLEERERRLADREATVAAAETHLTARVAELQTIQARLETLEGQRKAEEEANWAGLVKLYEGMRPRDAAVIFNALDKSVLLEIVDRMKPAKAAQVLAVMEPESARQVTADLAAKRTRSVTAAN